MSSRDGVSLPDARSIGLEHTGQADIESRQVDLSSRHGRNVQLSSSLTRSGYVFP